MRDNAIEAVYLRARDPREIVKVQLVLVKARLVALQASRGGALRSTKTPLKGCRGMLYPLPAFPILTAPRTWCGTVEGDSQEARS